MTAPLEHLSRGGRLDKFFIDGQWLEARGAAKGTLVNPATEEAVTRFALGNHWDVDAAVSAARRAFATWSRTEPNYRIGLLDRLQALLEARSELFAQCLSLEMGAAIGYARTAQVPLAIAHVKAARDVLQAFPFIKQRGHTAIAHEPIGVCALITPWNWPLYQITAKVSPALAAGCTVVLKPSELSPLDALLFAEAIEEAGFPAGVFNLVNGDGPSVGSALASHPDVDMISITGSTRAGIAVAQAAAPTVKRVAQELGGKSPNVILPDADLDFAVSMGIAAAFRNLGQSCSAPTRMIVPRARLPEIESLARKAADKIVIGDPLSEATTHGAIANRAQFDRIQTMIGVGIAEGATLVAGGEGRPAGLNAGFYVKPTIFSDVHTEMRIAQEEIFGPVLCLIPYDTVEEAITIANHTVYGLGAHVQGGNMDVVRDVASQIRCGQVHLNYPTWDPHAPFGGFKQSGNGREYGVEGMLEYLEVKSILGYF
ncbi:aldehyde dehydrogenase family protein [Rhizobium hidalgonense]|uniref:Aldehyde dehydrogenase family protein n=1 Tax=Rhizobium hidalgonense TaxID=1538159 RepID=A0A2A6KKF9_9HYPH|nr:aldehyde dehydrogenase family protein [Rhizobium hidalgonense]MDR9772070.1 aldehyde dehydrogenase family protein [Rhizobium hidalgonense]MDR9810128.1 aldehyde dehydrogenase family protein [Rhizobium hidalgonense]MDR9817844.1 aldehyde dehydrogenase family protein [Rhizobium hidalgonense]PDT25000.1 aldehyde dehydrogenase family protein [Rhizobium hidalgonense]PON06156.1 aldehyde dehydrogenase [Rhizobium hidalgonense]